MIFLLCFLAGIGNITAQNIKPKKNIKDFDKNFNKDFEIFYQKCATTRLDSIYNLHIAVLDEYNIIRDSYYEIVDIAKFSIFCKKFKEKSLLENNKALFRRALLIETYGNIKYKKVFSDVGEKKINDLYEDFLEEKDHSAALECLLRLALLHTNVRNKVQALKVLFFAEKFAEKYNLLKDISFQTILYRMGYILWDFEMPTNSIKYLKKSLETKNALYQDSLVTLNALGMNCQKIDDFENSLLYFDMCYNLAVRSKNDVFRDVVKGNLAVTLHKMDDQNKAFTYANDDKNMSFREGFWSNAVGALHWLVRIEIKRNNLTHAKILLDSLDNVISKTDETHFTSLKRQKEATYLYYEAVKNTPKALIAYKEFTNFDALSKEYANKNKISELQLNAEVRLYEQEMNEKEKEKQTIKYLFIFAIILLLVLMFFGVMLLYKRIRKIEGKKKEIEEINQTQAMQIATLKQQLFVQLADIKQNNANIQAIILPKNDLQIPLKTEEIIEELLESEEIIDEIAENQSETDRTNEILEFDTENLEVKQEDLQFLREFNLSKKDQWNSFKTSFLKIYPDFEQKLTSKMGETSSAELRLMMLHKLGLNSNEIALMLLISATSVRTGKYRLYKKLGINSMEELDNLL